MDNAQSQTQVAPTKPSIGASIWNELKYSFGLRSAPPVSSSISPCIELASEDAASQNSVPLRTARSDEPIRSAAEDVLGRAQVATAIAESIRNIEAGEGVVVAILGPWGSGKTSLVNLVLEELRKEPSLPVVHFNPWMFSGADQLVESFFTELGAQLRLADNRFKSLADQLARYGDLLAPLDSLPYVGVWTGAIREATKRYRQFMEDRQGGIHGLKKTLVAELQKLGTPIIVVIDDIDRLQTDEIRDVFKLVRLTANFPNVIYLVAFDRERVEKALEDQGLPGQAYLEKIAQVTYDIPAIPSHLFPDLVAGAINEVLVAVPESLKTPDARLFDVFHEVILPQFRHMRDVRRFVASLPATLRSLDSRIALGDVLALEALRVLQPTIFQWISQNAAILTTPKGGLFWLEQEDEKRAEAVKQFLKENPEREPHTRALIHWLFPAAERHIKNVVVERDSLPEWRRAHRVAHPEYLGLYLQRVAGQELESFWRAEEVLEQMTDRAAVEAYFRAIDPGEWDSLLRSLQQLGDAFPVEAARPATVALLNLIDEIPDRPPGFADFGRPRTQVIRVIVQLLRRLENADEVEAVVRQVLPEIGSAGARLELLKVVGHQENVGLEMISEEASNELEAELRDYIRTREPSELAADPEVLEILAWTQRFAEPSEPKFEFPDDNPLKCAVLKSAVSESTSFTTGTRVAQIEKRLFWGNLVDVLGGGDGVRDAVDYCRSVEGDKDLDEVISLADQYLSGWRPQSP